MRIHIIASRRHRSLSKRSDVLNTSILPSKYKALHQGLHEPVFLAAPMRLFVNSCLSLLKIFYCRFVSWLTHGCSLIWWLLGGVTNGVYFFGCSLLPSGCRSLFSCNIPFLLSEITNLHSASFSSLSLHYTFVLVNESLCYMS